MAMTPREKERVMKMLDELDRSTLQRVLASLESFANWLANAAYSIYCKIRDSLRGLWEWLCDIF
ncbi:hypothetical protein U14_01847 [Candidatus Moduliflexus flocculans]|uniref:Uncharacterized protein n=1 Tax=Candidatus Moduliflexus flocculans TaxID=1499966 RepID=A0A0S6VYX6_9BACT|nr:hypothetical protein U14_01847 [Candidatus Moduliflexus flocculans]